MKKKIISLLLAGVLLVFCGCALAEAAFTVKPNPPEGINYSYKYNLILLKAGEDMAFMDKYLYALDATTEEADGDVYVALGDLQKMYAPDFTVSAEGGVLTLHHAGLTAVLTAGQAEATLDGNAYTFKNAPKTVEGVVMVPALELMGVAFGKETKVLNNRSGNYYAVSYGAQRMDTSLYAHNVSVCDQVLAGKITHGFIYLTYTLEEDPDQKVLPVRLYIPYSYDPETPMRAVLLLHGNSVSQDYFWADTRPNIKPYKPLEMYAEENGYIIITPSAYLVGGQYGDVSNIPYMDAAEWAEIDDTEKELRIRSEKSAMTALELAKTLYNIDSEHLYLMGNSMGGKATLFLGNKYHELWDAIVPMAMMPNMSLVDDLTYENLTDMPLLFVEGTKDQYGFGLAVQNFGILSSRLNNVQHDWVKDGEHSTAWAMALPQIFEFLNAQY